MKVILILSFLFLLASSIDTICSANSDCPANATCSNSYCECNIPFILDCSIPAQFLTASETVLAINNITTYLQTESTLPDIYYSFMFQVCVYSSVPNYNLSFSLYVNTGQPQLDNTNFVGSVSVSLQQIIDSGTCVDLVQYSIKLEKQPNGQTQNLIVGLVIQPQSPNQEIDFASANVGIKVVSKQLVSSQLLIKLAIGIMSFAGFVVICIIIFCCYQRYKRKKQEQEKLTYQQQQVELFKKATPQIQAKQITMPAMTTCSICLGDFQPESKIRKTVCKHIFHSECIDSWCMKNLSCPVCRLDLDQDSIKKKQRQVELSSYNWNQNSLSARQELIQDLNPSNQSN